MAFSGEGTLNLDDLDGIMSIGDMEEEAEKENGATAESFYEEESVVHVNDGNVTAADPEELKPNFPDAKRLLSDEPEMKEVKCEFLILTLSFLTKATNIACCRCE